MISRYDWSVCCREAHAHSLPCTSCERIAIQKPLSTSESRTMSQTLARHARRIAFTVGPLVAIALTLANGVKWH